MVITNMQICAYYYKHCTLFTAPPAPLKANVTMTTRTSISLLLRASEPYNLNGIIKSYEIEYQRLLPERGDKQIISIAVMSGEFSVHESIHNLTDNSNYSIRVSIKGPLTTPLAQGLSTTIS